MIGGDPIAFLLWSLFLVPALFVAIPGHELGHALAADRLGDRSVRAFGNLKPQFRRFLDPYGVIAVFLANVGWGRPAPIQEGRIGYSGTRRALYALGGPAANLALAAVFGVAVRLLIAAGYPPVPEPRLPLNAVVFIVYAIYFLNLSLFAFQLLPIPGLDGWDIVAALFRRRNPGWFMRVEANRQTIWIVCLIVIFVGPLLLRFNLLGAVVGIFYEPASYLILGRCTGYIVLNPCPL